MGQKSEDNPEQFIPSCDNGFSISHTFISFFKVVFSKNAVMPDDDGPREILPLLRSNDKKWDDAWRKGRHDGQKR
ncbi:MAG: hypothetical protein ISR95_00025 [Candidatus Marinimicrobia bacterium]|nr:hypothetical protein [Candidatus Neomarinimicrobiota bacterium]